MRRYRSLRQIAFNILHFFVFAVFFSLHCVFLFTVFAHFSLPQSHFQSVCSCFIFRSQFVAVMSKWHVLCHFFLCAIRRLKNLLSQQQKPQWYTFKSFKENLIRFFICYYAALLLLCFDDGSISVKCELLANRNVYHKISLIAIDLCAVLRYNVCSHLTSACKFVTMVI